MLTGFLTAFKILAARLAFFLVLIVLLPLAVLNRQMVELVLNPFAIIGASGGFTVILPLFIVLFIAFALGMILGYGLAAIGKKPSKAKPTSPAILRQNAPQTASGEGLARMVNSRHGGGSSKHAGDEHLLAAQESRDDETAQPILRKRAEL